MDNHEFSRCSAGDLACDDSKVQPKPVLWHAAAYDILRAGCFQDGAECVRSTKASGIGGPEKSNNIAPNANA
jgi:hypothetical protein